MTPTTSSTALHVCMCNPVPRIRQISKQRTATSRASTLRYYCNVINCTSTFARPSDVFRHERSIHGPKEQCRFLGCAYATARTDKMKEHCRKKHSAFGETEHRGRKPLQSSFVMENLSVPSINEAMNPGYLESDLRIFSNETAGPRLFSDFQSKSDWESNNSNSQCSDPGLINPHCVGWDFEATKNEAVNSPPTGWEIVNSSFSASGAVAIDTWSTRTETRYSTSEQTLPLSSLVLNWSAGYSEAE